MLAVGSLLFLLLNAAVAKAVEFEPAEECASLEKGETYHFADWYKHHDHDADSSSTPCMLVPRLHNVNPNEPLATTIHIVARLPKTKRKDNDNDSDSSEDESSDDSSSSEDEHDHDRRQCALVIKSHPFVESVQGLTCPEACSKRSNEACWCVAMDELISHEKRDIVSFVSEDIYPGKQYLSLTCHGQITHATRFDGHLSGKEHRLKLESFTLSGSKPVVDASSGTIVGLRPMLLGGKHRAHLLLHNAKYAHRHKKRKRLLAVAEAKEDSSVKTTKSSASADSKDGDDEAVVDDEELAFVNSVEQVLDFVTSMVASMLDAVDQAIAEEDSDSSGSASSQAATTTPASVPEPEENFYITHSHPDVVEAYGPSQLAPYWGEAHWHRQSTPARAKQQKRTTKSNFRSEQRTSKMPKRLRRQRWVDVELITDGRSHVSLVLTPLKMHATAAKDEESSAYFDNEWAHGCHVQVGEQKCTVAVPSLLDYFVDVVNIGDQPSMITVDASRAIPPPTPLKTTHSVWHVIAFWSVIAVSSVALLLLFGFTIKALVALKRKKQLKKTMAGSIKLPSPRAYDRMREEGEDSYYDHDNEAPVGVIADDSDFYPREDESPFEVAL